MTKTQIMTHHNHTEVIKITEIEPDIHVIVIQANQIRIMPGAITHTHTVEAGVGTIINTAVGVESETDRIEEKEDIITIQITTDPSLSVVMNQKWRIEIDQFKFRRIKFDPEMNEMIFIPDFDPD